MSPHGRNIQIAFDFDGTVVLNRYPDIGSIVPGSLEWLRRFRRYGIDLILYTIRSGDSLDKAVKLLRNHGIDLYAVNDNPSQRSWSSSRKIYADLYIDDSAVGCPLIESPDRTITGPAVNWSKVGPIVSERISRLRNLR